MVGLMPCEGRAESLDSAGGAPKAPRHVNQHVQHAKGRQCGVYQTKINGMASNKDKPAHQGGSLKKSGGIADAPRSLSGGGNLDIFTCLAAYPALPGKGRDNPWN